MQTELFNIHVEQRTCWISKLQCTSSQTTTPDVGQHANGIF